MRWCGVCAGALRRRVKKTKVKDVVFLGAELSKNSAHIHSVVAVLRPGRKHCVEIDVPLSEDNVLFDCLCQGSSSMRGTSTEKNIAKCNAHYL